MAATIMESAGALAGLVQELAAERDEAGMLSITVGVEHTSPAGSTTPAWEIALRNDLSRLRHDGAVRELLETRLESTRELLADALDPVTTGRGRALFVGLGSGATVEVSVRPSLPTGARVGSVAHVLPLLAVLHEGAPAGLVSISRDAVSVSESELGIARDVDRIDLEPWVGDWWPEMKGPARANPLRGQQTVSQRDRYQRHVAEAYRHTLRDAASTLASLARRRHWTRAVLAGDPRTTGPLESALVDAGLATTTIGANLEGLRHDEATARLGAALEELVAERSLQLVARIEEAGARGPGPVVAALNEARVATLVLDPCRSFPGGVGPEELLEVVEGDGNGAVDIADAVVARALATGATVVPVSGAPAAALEGAGGVGALLRW
jgi:Bacterial archaeo-eukaryotic release factor family 10